MPSAPSDRAFQARLARDLADRFASLADDAIALRLPVDGFVDRVIGLHETARQEGVTLEVLRLLRERARTLCDVA